MAGPTRTFVLVHGGGHGGWCWQPTARRLRQAGHEVSTPTLTGFGERNHLPADGFQTFVTDVVNVLRFEDLHDVVLVGHSMGGVVVPRVAEEVPDRLRRVVWLAAAVCADGETMLEATPRSEWIARAVRIGPDGTPTTDPELILDAAIHDGTPAERDFVRARHLPYPPHALTEPGRLSAFLALGLPTAYVVATRDRIIEPEVAERFASRLPGCARATVDAGHDCMITRPDEVADVLVTLAG